MTTMQTGNLFGRKACSVCMLTDCTLHLPLQLPILDAQTQHDCSAVRAVHRPPQVPTAHLRRRGAQTIPYFWLQGSQGSQGRQLPSEIPYRTVPCHCTWSHVAYLPICLSRRDRGFNGPGFFSPPGPLSTRCRRPWCLPVCPSSPAKIGRPIINMFPFPLVPPRLCTLLTAVPSSGTQDDTSPRQYLRLETSNNWGDDNDDAEWYEYLRQFLCRIP